MESVEVLRVIEALRAAGIGVGITGGWGIDALLGRETRVHRDLDLGVDAGLVASAVEVLATLGYAIAVDERPARLELHADAGQVDIHPIVFEPDGFGVQTGSDGDRYVYPVGSLEAIGSIGGRRVACGTPELQVAFHLGYAPGTKDRSDMAALRDGLGIELPDPYAD